MNLIMIDIVYVVFLGFQGGMTWICSSGGRRNEMP